MPAEGASAPNTEPAPAARRVQLVVNPRSGKGAGRRAADELTRALEAGGATLSRIETRPRDEPDVFEQLGPGGWDAITVLGGDGSFHVALNGLAEFSTPLAFHGVGTINVLSRELALPAAPDAFSAMLLRGRRLRVPLLRANQRRFALFAEVGFLARIVCLTNTLRERVLHRHGRAEFALAALAVLPFAWFRRLHVEAETPDGRTLRRNYSNVLFTRARCYAGSIRVPMEPGVEQPLAEASFELVGLRSATPLGHLLALTLGALGKWTTWERRLERWGLVERVRVTRARVSGPRGSRVHVDAESTFPSGPLTLPLEVGPDAASVELIVP